MTQAHLMSDIEATLNLSTTNGTQMTQNFRNKFGN